jgi:hypothetical protein
MQQALDRLAESIVFDLLAVLPDSIREISLPLANAVFEITESPVIVTIWLHRFFLDPVNPIPAAHTPCCRVGMPAHRASLYMCQLEDAIKDRLSEVGIMEDNTPRGKWLVRGEDDGLRSRKRSWTTWKSTLAALSVRLR